MHSSCAVLLLLLLLLSPCSTFVAADGSALSIGGYLPEYRTYIDVNKTATILTDLFLFSVSPRKSGFVGGCCLDESHYRIGREARAYKAEQQRGAKLRVWVAVGGAGRSDAFLGLCSNPDQRDTFVENLIALCRKEQLDGVDFDWEQPSTEHEYNSYVRFLLYAADELHDEGLLISVTTKHKFQSSVMHKLDRVNFMAYDLIIPNGPKHHADYDIVTQVIDNWLQEMQYPANKTMLGLPAYARHRDQPGNVKTYAELIDDGMDVSEDNYRGYMYDSPGRIARKVQYAKNRGLGGVFFWEIGQDKMVDGNAGILLEAAIGAGGLPGHSEL